MNSRPRHPNKEIEMAIRQLEELGWSWKKAGGSAHAWGRMLCPQHDAAGCQVPGVGLVDASFAGKPCQAIARPRKEMRAQWRQRMTAFDFAIIASGLDHTADDFEDRFFEAGCDDATIAVARGAIVLQFRREAETLNAAIDSAVAAVVTAGAHVERVEPDPLVSLSEIAERSGLTRAAVTNYAKGERGEAFPPPVARVTSASPLWNWPDVAGWLHARGQLSSVAVAEAAVIKGANEGL